MKKKVLAVFLFIVLCLSGVFSMTVQTTACAATVTAECVMDADSRRILYESRGDTRLPMASTTKILTAISVLEAGVDLAKTVKIPKEAAGVEGSSVYLKEGDEYSVGDLLYGLMLRSGNDCAVALALEVDGSIEKFSTRMNRTAEKAGAFNSRFRTPHGLPKSGHYTTAVDLSLITSYALQNAVFQKIVSAKFYEPRGWANKNKMLTLYEGAIGVKTGYTKEAGRCLVSAAERDGLRLVCTVLNRSDTYERSIKLLDDAFSAYQRVAVLEEGEEISLQRGEKTIKAVAKDTVYYPLMEEEKGYLERIVTPYTNSANKEIIGQIQIFLFKRLLFSGFLYTI